VSSIIGIIFAGMATKSQHSRDYEPLRALLRSLRQGAGLTQRDLGERMGKPQSWIHNCEVGNRRVDVSEFTAWANACEVKPVTAFRRFLSSYTQAETRRSGLRRR
jgi:transcriptional regulator with XRE-family HTH domain